MNCASGQLETLPQRSKGLHSIPGWVSGELGHEPTLPQLTVWPWVSPNLPTLDSYLLSSSLLFYVLWARDDQWFSN